MPFYMSLKNISCSWSLVSSKDFRHISIVKCIGALTLPHWDKCFLSSFFFLLTFMFLRFELIRSEDTIASPEAGRWTGRLLLSASKLLLVTFALTANRPDSLHLNQVTSKRHFTKLVLEPFSHLSSTETEMCERQSQGQIGKQTNRQTQR